MTIFLAYGAALLAIGGATILFSMLRPTASKAKGEAEQLAIAKAALREIRDEVDECDDVATIAKSALAELEGKATR